MGDIIRFPQRMSRVPDCRICQHALVADETYCRVYKEMILNEPATAAECERFEDDELKV